MAVKTLTYVILGRDQLTPVARKAGANVEGVFSKLGSMAGMMGLTTGVAAIGYESIKMATSFQSSMEKVHTQAGASQKDIAGLSQAVLNLGMHAQQSPQHLADSLYHLKSIGLDNVSAMKALKVASDLAAVGGADLESTTNALGGAWRSGIKGAESFGKTAATVNAIIGAGNMRMEDFTSAIGTGILPAAKTFGVSLQSVGSALALMTDEGIPADEAATRLKMSLSLLAAPSGAASKWLGKIGLTGLQLANTMRGPSGLVGAIALLKDHLDKSGMSASQQAILLSHAFGGGRSSSAILTMVNNLDVLKKKQDQINKTTGNYGDAVVQQRKTAQAQFAILKNVLDVLAIRLGTALLPPLTKFAQFLTGTAIPRMQDFGHTVMPVLKSTFGYFEAGMQAIIKLFNILPGPVKIATVAIIAIGVAMRLAAAANPWLLLATTLIIVTGVIVKHWGQIKNTAIAVLGFIGNSARITWNQVGGFFKSMWTGILRPLLLALLNTFLNIAGSIVHGAAIMFGWIPKVGDKLRGAARAFDTFRDNVNNAINGVHGKTISVSVAMTAKSNPYPGGISGRAATGGHVRGPGGPTSDSAGLYALSNNEWVVRASSAQKYGYAAMDAVNRGRAQIRYAAGGGEVTVHPGAPSASSIGHNIWNTLVKTVQASSSSLFASIGGGMSNYSAGGGVARWAPLILRVLAMYGQSPAWLGTVERRMNQESGGNPNAINNWDSNAMRGDPSRGLMQTIGSTFNAYAGPFRSMGIYNPFANIYAAIGYALATYGSLAALNRPGGYKYGGMVSFDSGGYLPPHSATMAINGTSSYEPVGNAGRGNTYNINIAPTPMARPADIGREVVDAIRAFERGAGKGWRN